MLLAKSQHSLDQKQFHSAIGPRLHQFVGGRARQRVKHFTSQIVIDRTPVIGIHEAIIPNFVALIDVRHARRDQFQQR